MQRERERESRNWRTVKLGDLLNFKYGKFNKNPDNGGQYPIYGANGIIGGYTEYNAEDSIVIGHIGQAGSVNWAKGKHFVTYNGVITTAKNGIDLKLIYYILQNLNLPSLAEGNAQKFISYDTLNRIEIQIPNNLAEQKAIASILSNFDNLADTIDSEVENLVKQKNQIMQKIFK